MDTLPICDLACETVNWVTREWRTAGIKGVVGASVSRVARRWAAGIKGVMGAPQRGDEIQTVIGNSGMLCDGRRDRLVHLRGRGGRPCSSDLKGTALSAIVAQLPLQGGSVHLGEEGVAMLYAGRNLGVG